MHWSFSYKVGRGTALTALVALIACGTSADRSQSPELLGTSTQAVSGGNDAGSGVTSQINVTLPTGTSIVDTTVGAAGSIWFNANDQILGPTGSAGGAVEVEPLAKASAINTVGNVEVDLAGTVNGNIVAGGQILSLGTVNGTKTPHSGATASTTTWSVTNPGGSQGPINLLLNAVASPTPGTYDNVFVGPGSSLYLHSGTYFFQSFDLELGANLFIDSSLGPVFVDVTSSLLFFRGTEESLDGSTPQFFMTCFGTNVINLEAPYQGVFLAPNALQLHLEDALWVLDPVKQANGNHATFYSKSIFVDPGEIINPAAFDWSTVPGFPIPPGGWAAVGGTMGTGTPGSGGAGGTGGGGGKVTTGSLPPAGVTFHLTPQAGTSTSSTVTPSGPVPFHAPPSFDVGGVIANGTVTLTYTSCTGGTVTCTYQGGSSSASPTTLEDIEAGRTATLVSCSDGQSATALRCGTSFSLAATGVSGWPLSVDLIVDDRSCGKKVDILTPVQTRKMMDSFAWPDKNLKSPPLVAETAKDSTGHTIPDLYYGWVYLRNTKDLLRLRQMYVHILSRPLYTSELEPYAGQCVTFENPGDGIGSFVPVIIPGQVYNTILNVQNYAFDDAQSTKISHDQPPLFEAVILRSTTPIDFTTLKNSGFRYLDYEHGPIAQSAMKLQGGAAAEVFQDAATFALQAVQTVQGVVTDALGTLDALFANRIHYNMTINIDNSGVPFTSNYATRAWGTTAGSPLGAGGLKVTLFENLLGVIPETFGGYTNDSGYASIQPAKHSSSDVKGTGFCVTLQNDALLATTFLLPNEVCNLGGFDRLEVGLATTVSTNPINVPDFSTDQTFSLVMSDWQLSTVYQATDAYRYLQRVSGKSIPAAHALVGETANLVGLVNGGRASTFGLHLRNGGGGFEQTIKGIVDSYTSNFSTLYPATAETISGLALGPAFFTGLFTNNDIVFPDKAVDPTGSGAREVGSHEMGHFILMDSMFEENGAAIDSLIGDSLLSFRSTDYSYSTRYINEAFAEFITGQVTGMANYQWLSLLVANGALRQDQFSKVCISLPCYDENFNASPTSNTDKAGIARFATLLHDAFDGQPNELNRNQNQPDNADPWAQSSNNKGPFSYTATPWGDSDGPDLVRGLVPACRVGTGPQFVTVGGTTPPACVASESVALPGKDIVTFAAILADISSTTAMPYLTDQNVFTALDKTMIKEGYNWCQRCQVLALHVPEIGNPEPGMGGDAKGPIDLLRLCSRGDAPANHPDEDSSLAAWGLPAVPAGTSPPEPNIRLDASTCKTCPAEKFPDANGRCTQDCPADFTIDGGSFQFGDTPSETLASSITPGTDPCPGVFILEIDHPDQFFSPRGAAAVTGSIDVDSPSETCNQSFSLTLSDLPASSTTGFVTEQTNTTTGSFDEDAGFNLGCRNLSSIQLTSSTLTSGSVPIRFSTAVIPGVSFSLNVSTTLPPPQ